MIKNWSEKGQLLFVVLLIAIFAIVLGWIFGGWMLTIGLLFAIVSILQLARRIWLSDKSNFLLRSATIGVISLALLSSNSFGWNLIASLIHYVYPKVNLPANELAPLTLVFLLIFTFIVFYFTRDSSSFGKTEKPIDKLIEGPTIKQKWENVCRGLEAQIRDIDRDTNWSNEYYTPLEAEVEMRTSEGTKKVVKDLLDAIKQSEDRLFLLIGDPGAGKSVALRKLSLDILKESVKTEYIPIYVNLKEWVTDHDWITKPPTWKNLEAFVKESLGNKDRHLADFFDKFYDVLDENGNLFFILDSFDEIPQVLGTTAESKLIEDLTRVCREFLVGAKQPRSRGVLASREYRMPRADYLEANTTLLVRPFTYEKIEQTLLQSGKVAKEAIEYVFRDRRDLIPILRNPFITSLLQNYLIDNNGQLPQNQAKLFSDYIEKSIQKAQKRLGKTQIPLEDIIKVATQIAKIIFSESGLQAPLSLLRRHVICPDFDEIIALLRYTRIARGNTSGTDMFSFTHRRFYEYFVVRDLLQHDTLDLPLESIPTDSRWRDTLVLYCEVAPFEQAQRIANYCWYNVIVKNKSIRHRYSKHCLRFLSEAFKGRQECLCDFQDDLAEFILAQLHPDNDPIDIKLAVEALGILGQDNIDKGSIKAFQLYDPWINDTALRSCRHLATISKDLEIALLSIIDPRFIQLKYEYTLFQVVRNRTNLIQMSLNELLFSLSLSEAFTDFRLIIEWQIKETNHQRNTSLLFLFPSVLILLFYFTYIYIFENVQLMKNISFGYFFIFWIYFSILTLYTYIYPIILKKLHFSRSLKLKPKTYWFPKIFYLKGQRKALAIAFKMLAAFFAIFILFAVALLMVFSTTLKSTLFLSIGALYFLLFTLMGYLVFTYYRYRKKFENTNKDELNNRYNIALIYNQFNWPWSNKFLRMLIVYLENNVKKVSGEFPDGFLKVGKGPMMTRLIQLEEKWREAEERELEEIGSGANKNVSPTDTFQEPLKIPKPKKKK